MPIAELARRAGIAPSAVHRYEQVGVLPTPERAANGYREYADADVARLRLVVALRRLGLGPEDAGRLARLCLEQGAVDLDLGPPLAEQHLAIVRRRDDLDRLEGELIDLEMTIAAAGRARRTYAVPDPTRSACSSCARTAARAARSPRPCSPGMAPPTSRSTRPAPRRPG